MEELSLIKEEFNIPSMNSGHGHYISALAVFPADLWEQVVGSLEDYQDILNVLTAFSDLDQLFKNKKFEWLFPQILPHIMTKHLLNKQLVNSCETDFLLSTELFKLRLVSKRWKRAVEHSLENHADRHPPMPLHQNTVNNKSLAILPENHFNYQQMKKFRMGATIFRKDKHIDRFIREMSNYHGNPFPGRYVVINSDHMTDTNYDTIYPDKALELLQKFGRHIFVLDWKFLGCGSDNDLEVYDAFLQGLSYVPNLKSLKIHGVYTGPYAGIKTFIDAQKTQNTFPELPFLESFDWKVWNVLNSSWIDNMINHYGKQDSIQKLVLDVDSISAEVASNFRQLTELHLLLEHEELKDHLDIEEVLKKLPKGQIRKLCLSDQSRRRISKYFCINKFVKMLADFNFECVILDKFHLSELDDGELNDEASALSITSFYFEDNAAHTYQFLKRLPNLRYLTIYMSEIPQSYADLKKRNDLFSDMIRTYYTQHYVEPRDSFKDFSIWKELPKLEILNISGHNGEETLDVQYVREYGNKPFFGQRSEAIDFECSDEDEDDTDQVQITV